jgi:hypothetical protein
MNYLFREPGGYQRIQQDRYANLFFSYSVPDDMIADSAMEAFLSDACLNDPGRNADIIRDMIRSKGQKEFMWSLNLALERNQYDLNVAVAVSMVGDDVMEGSQVAQLILGQIIRVQRTSQQSEEQIIRAMNDIILNGFSLPLVSEVVILFLTGQGSMSDRLVSQHAYQRGMQPPDEE